MKGHEKYVNSGWMLPAGMIPPGMAPITDFTITFEKPGTYNYLCIIHPWMTGTIDVV
jgi:plastocyanin